MTAGTILRRKLAAAMAMAIAALALAAFAAPAGAAIDIKEFDNRSLEANGDPATQAGSHPFRQATEFFVSNVERPVYPFIFLGNASVPTESFKDLSVELPPGLVGNPQGIPRCTQTQFTTNASEQIYDSCPIDSQVGYARLWWGGFPVAFYGTRGLPIYSPIYNMEVPPGTPALLGFSVVGTPGYIAFETRTGDDYGLTALSSNIPATLQLLGIEVHLWGVPADPVHDRERGYDDVTGISCPNPEEATEAGCITHSSPAPLRPFISLPTSCTGPVESTLSADGWESAGEFTTVSVFSHDNTEPTPNPIGLDGCNAVDFSPSIETRPTTNVADSASGLDVDLRVPQHETCDPGPPVSCENAEAHLRDTTVTLPEGLVVNPASGNGLGGCSEAQFGYTSTDPDGTIHTTAAPASCPEASKQGTVTVETPLLDHPLKGSVYLANPHQNPFGSLVALYISVNDPQTGTVVKLAGKVALDPNTGRISATFNRAPQLPFEHFKLHFFGGAGGALRTPATCGTYTTTSVLTPWTAPDSGPPATPTDPWAIQTAPGGGNCATSPGALPNSPDLDAGSVSPVAGTSTPTLVNLRRNDGSQEFSSVSLTLPPGLTGRLAGIGQCSDADLATAAQKTGQQEKSSPSCPALQRPGHGLPDRPLQGRPAGHGDRHPGDGRPLRLGNGGRPGGPVG
jgi:hypothetical protein